MPNHMPQRMKVIVLGAGGRLGSRVLAECVRQGHQATAFVRSGDRLRAAIGEELLRAVTVAEGDVLDASALRAAMRGQEACVQVGWVEVGGTGRQTRAQFARACTRAASAACLLLPPLSA